jgi:hypothetical protein
MLFNVKSLRQKMITLERPSNVTKRTGMHMSVKKLADESNDEAPRNPLAHGAGPPYDGRMEARVAKLEEIAGEVRAEPRSIDVRLGRIETRLDVMDTRLDSAATKEDLQKCMNALIKWIVATGAVLGASAITVMTFVLNNAIPKSNPTTPPPIVIVVPTQPSVSPALPTK